MTSIFSTEVSKSVVVKPIDKELYEIKTDNNEWSTVDHISFGDTGVEIKTQSVIKNVTLKMASSMSHGLVAVFQFNGEPNIQKDE